MYRSIDKNLSNQCHITLNRAQQPVSVHRQRSAFEVRTSVTNEKNLGSRDAIRGGEPRVQASFGGNSAHLEISNWSEKARATDSERRYIHTWLAASVMRNSPCFPPSTCAASSRTRGNRKGNPQASDLRSASARSSPRPAPPCS